MLALIGSILAAILIAILLFALGYTRLIGSNQEQRTAIEAAALAAAKDISRIVINDQNFGYVSLSDAAPVGKDTIAGDNYFMPVNGIDTLMGTIRLDLIIADALGNQTMKALAKRDLQNLKTAKDKLVDVIETAIQNGGNAKDLDGNNVTPYQSAEAAYTQNQIRMTGKSSYVPNSLRLTLGSLEGGTQTYVPVPKPSAYKHTNSSQEQNGYYLSSVNCQYDGEDFIFAAVGGDSVKLVDPKRFAISLPLPYQMPSIIKAEADQDLTDTGSGAVRRVHAVACAEPASVYDPKPAPGTLTISFPDNMPPEILSLRDLFNIPGMGNPMDLKRADGNDYPLPGSSIVNLPWGGPGTGDGTTIVSTSIYDWLKRAGTRVDAGSAVGLITQPLSNTNGDPKIHIFSYKTDGSINYVSKAPLDVEPYWLASQNQLYGVAQDLFTSTDTYAYDMHVRDYGFIMGTMNGGKHGGEPLSLPNQILPIPVAMGPSETSTTVTAHPSPLHLAYDGKSGSGSGGDCGGSGDGASSWVWIGSPPPGPPYQVTIGGTNFKIWPNACGGGSALLRNDFGIGVGGATVPFTIGPGGGDRRPTYLQNGAVADIRFRRVYEYTDQVDLVTIRKGYKSKKE